MERALTGKEGVVVFRGVPVVDAADQRGPAYLHIEGLSRDLPSHEIRVFVDDDTVSPETGLDHPAFAGDAMTYNSPPVPGRPEPAATDRPLPDRHGSYDMLIDLSGRPGEAMMSGATMSGATVDVTLVVTALDGRPLDTSRFEVEGLFITRFITGNAQS